MLHRNCCLLIMSSRSSWFINPLQREKKERVALYLYYQRSLSSFLVMLHCMLTSYKRLTLRRSRNVFPVPWMFRSSWEIFVTLFTNVSTPKFQPVCLYLLILIDATLGKAMFIFWTGLNLRLFQDFCLKKKTRRQSHGEEATSAAATSRRS